MRNGSLVDEWEKFEVTVDLKRIVIAAPLVATVMMIVHRLVAVEEKMNDWCYHH